MKWSLLLSLLCLASLAHGKPNIILVLCDDLGYGDLGITGHPYVKSPHLDQFAREGMRFENGYMSAAWCAPSRYALMSGRYPIHYFQETKEMETEAPNLYRVLASVGYRTAHFGKWHMSGRGADDPQPADYGVDEDFIANGNEEGWTKEERRAPHWRENTTKKYVDLTIDFMERHRESEQPFYVNLWVFPTHSYIDPRPDMLEPFQDLQVDISDFENPQMREFLGWIDEQGEVQEAMRAYCADVAELDHHLGRLMAALQELGLEEETLVIFSSDNGPAPLGTTGNRKGLAERIAQRPTLINCVGSAGPLRDRKVSLHDGGIRVPFFVRWPGKVPPGSINTETIFTGVDLLPTLASLVGADLPEELDGENLLASFAGQESRRSQAHFWNDRPGWTALREEQWKAHLQGEDLRLFDLETDPSESVDLAASLPEKAEYFRKKLEAWERQFAPSPN
ncbi:MAG: sulfatase-like hydrolase/transferase [Verrucomicrobiota bacterium]